MIAVIFEVRPKPDRTDRYFELAAALRDELERSDGFLSVERFQSLTDDGKFLSISFWRDREAVETWYNHAGHAFAQEEGRIDVFDDYRIRVADVFRDYDMASGRSG